MRPSPWSVLLLLLPAAALARSIDVGLPSEGLAPRPFEDLARQLLHVQTDSYGVARGTSDLGEDPVYWIVDGNCSFPRPSFSRRPSPDDCSPPGNDGTWTHTWRRPYLPTLVLDGVPQAAWRPPSLYAFHAMMEP